NWKLRELTLGFEHITGRHTSTVLMQSFVGVVERFGLQRKITAITSDNGANVVKMMRDLEAFTAQNSDR
ncbi:hypothetical protein DFQ27_002747, partial [Actinomortierella ambigua]